MLSTSGVVNQVLTAIGLGGITRAWLADFDTAAAGRRVHRCLGLARPLHDPAADGHEQDRPGPLRIGAPGRRWRRPGVPLDHAPEPAPGDRRLHHGHRHRRPGELRHRVHRHRRRTRPGRPPCPGSRSTSSPSRAGRSALASALAVVLLIVLVLACVLPIQRLDPWGRVDDRRSTRDAGRAGCCCSSSSGSRCSRSSVCCRPRWHPRTRRRRGSSGRRDPQWGNFVDAFNVAHMRCPAPVERPHRARGRAGGGHHRDHGRLRHRPPPHPRRPLAVPRCS